MIFWAVVGIVGLAALLISFRIARRRRKSLDDYRAGRDEAFEQEQREMRDSARRVSAGERRHIVWAALDDLIRLADRPEGFSLEAEEREPGAVLLHTPSCDVRISFENRESMPPMLWRSRSARCGVPGAPGLWRIAADGRSEDFPDVLHLMRRLDLFFRGGPLFDEEKPEYSRRFPMHLH